MSEKQQLAGSDFPPAMLEELPAMIWCVDANGENAWFNRAFRRFAGWTADCGLERSSLLHPDDREAFASDLRTAIFARDPVRLQARNLRSDGEYRWFLDTGVPWYSPDGKMGGYIAVCQDVTEYGQVKEELKAFADAVSRDFRSPIASIRGYLRETDRCLERLGLLFSRHADQIPDVMETEGLSLLEREVPAAHQNIHASLARLETLLAGLSKLSLLGRRIPYAEPVATRDLVEGIVESYAERVQEKGITVTVGELPVMVVDRLALEQILGSLIDNALKYLDPARPGVVEIGTEMRDMEVIFHVRDNGRGMRHEDIPNVFQLFRRAGKQDVPGEGMGLPFVKTLVRELGGRIWCVSSPAEGSTFSFALPFVPLQRSEEVHSQKVCELADRCPFFNDQLGEMPATATRMKERYCWGEKQECARYMIFSRLGGGHIPKGLSPSDTDEAREILAHRS
jgi:PAS domain S-box-containing protein